MDGSFVLGFSDSTRTKQSLQEMVSAEASLSTVETHFLSRYRSHPPSLVHMLIGFDTPARLGLSFIPIDKIKLTGRACSMREQPIHRSCARRADQTTSAGNNTCFSDGRRSEWFQHEGDPRLC